MSLLFLGLSRPVSFWAVTCQETASSVRTKWDAWRPRSNCPLPGDLGDLLSPVTSSITCRRLQQIRSLWTGSHCPPNPRARRMWDCVHTWRLEFDSARSARLVPTFRNNWRSRPTRILARGISSSFGTTGPPLWSSGQSSWLHNGDVLCFLWGTNWIYIYVM
jgi:hypothetical protein